MLGKSVRERKKKSKSLEKIKEMMMMAALTTVVPTFKHAQKISGRDAMINDQNKKREKENTSKRVEEKQKEKGFDGLKCQDGQLLFLGAFNMRRRKKEFHKKQPSIFFSLWKEGKKYI